MNTANDESGVEQAACDFRWRISALDVSAARGRPVPPRYGNGDRQKPTQRIPANRTPDMASAPTSNPMTARRVQRLAARDEVENKMPAGPQMPGDTPQCTAQIARRQQMIDRIEVGGDEIDIAWQPEATNVLAQKPHA